MLGFATGTAFSLVIVILFGGYSTLFLGHLWQPLVPLGVVAVALVIVTIVALFLAVGERDA